MAERSFSKRMLVFQTTNGYYINAVLALISIVTYSGEYRFGDFFYRVWPCLAVFRYRVWPCLAVFVTVFG